MKYYQQSLENIFQELKSSKTGLTEKEAFLRLDKYGANRLEDVKKESWIIKFFHQFTDLLAIILIAVGFLSLVIGDPKGAAIVFTIVFINAVIGFAQEYKAERILDAFKNYLPPHSKVVRDGALKEVLTSQLVPGDILVLEAGDSVGADARLIEAFDLKTNDFSLTGESQPQARKVGNIEKDMSISEIDNMVFMGTSVAEGESKAVVVHTGHETEFGRIAVKSQEIEQGFTPLQKELNHTGKVIAKIAVIGAILMFAILYLMGKSVGESLMFAIVAGAALCPEGLPAAMSIALSMGAQNMLKKKALVKKLVHVESLGSVTAICTDKTGTLTTGDMTVVSTYPLIDKLSPEEKSHLLNNMILCNNASIDKKARGIGDFLEVALLKYAQNEKQSIDEIQSSNSRNDEIPFSSIRKMMTVVCKNSKSEIRSTKQFQNNNDQNSKYVSNFEFRDSNFFVYTKGACLEILERCKISQTEKKKIIAENDRMAKSGLRVLAFAYKIIKDQYEKETLEKDLIFLGIAGLKDPPREGVNVAIHECRAAKIRVFMVTGDYGLTAQKIGEEIGLAQNNARIITGEDLRKMDDVSLKKVLEKETIFARIDPEQKLRIVANLQETGEVVAVTGDGVNDAPALVKADIGVSMGKIGTDVAKEASDMILLDDHFSTIVNAVKEGRRIYENAKKIVFYVFSSNSGELFVPLMGILLGLPLPLIAIQILAIDLGTDVFPSLALGVEKAEPGVMNNPPRSKTERIMSVNILYKLLKVGITMGILGLLTFIFSLYEGGWRYGEFLDTNSELYFRATASVYASLVICQFANILSCRSENVSAWKLFWTNPWLIYSEFLSFVMLWGIMDWKPLQTIFKTASPTPLAWLLIVISFFVFLGIFERAKKIKITSPSG